MEPEELDDGAIVLQYAITCNGFTIRELRDVISDIPYGTIVTNLQESGEIKVINRIRSKNRRGYMNVYDITELGRWGLEEYKHNRDCIKLLETLFISGIDEEIIGHIPNDMPALYYLQEVGKASHSEIKFNLGHKYSARLRILKRRGDINSNGRKGSHEPYYLTDVGKEGIKIWENAHKKDAKLVKSLISKISP